MQDLLIRHTIDVMHCEKNLCENIMRTILGEADYPRGRRDMEEMGIRPELWLRLREGTEDEYAMPHATYVMKNEEKRAFLEFMKSVRTPTDYSSAIHSRVEDGRMRFLKSHDYHVLMQQVSILFQKKLSRVCWLTHVPIIHLVVIVSLLNPI